jgi:hypothetical protein
MHRGDGYPRRAGQSLLKNDIMPGINITSSENPFPVTGQRVVRGVLLLVLISMSIATLMLVIWLGIAISGREARIAPAIARADGGELVPEVTNTDAISFAYRFVATAENWSFATVKSQPTKLRAQMHPTLFQTFDDKYKETARTAEQFSQSRSAVPIAGIVGSRENGVIRVAVKFDVLELTGRATQERKVTADTDRIAIVGIVQDVKSDENPDGLLVASYVLGSAADWLKARKPKFWKDERY